MAVRTPQAELIRHLEEAVAMEEAVVGALRDMVPTTDDSELRGTWSATSARPSSTRRG